MEEVFEKTKSFEQTINLRRIIGVKVLTERGFSIGRVVQLRIGPNMKNIEGILIKRGIFGPLVFFGATYLDKLTPEGIVLNMEPAILLRGRKVVTYDGEVIGSIREIVRFGGTNDIKNLVVHSFLRGTFNVPIAEIKSLGKSIILKNTYNAPKKSLWRRS